MKMTLGNRAIRGNRYVYGGSKWPKRRVSAKGVKRGNHLEREILRKEGKHS